MNKIVTSKEEILKISRELIQKDGWKSLNIRSLAAACDISVGSVYNYFQNKSDLLNATVESVWRDIFHFSENATTFESFIDCVEWAFESMKRGEEKYPGFFAFHSMIIVEAGSVNGHALMEQSWRHIHLCFYHILKKDPHVDFTVFDDTFTPETFVDIIFSLMISAMTRHSYDYSAITAMIRRTIYYK